MSKFSLCLLGCILIAVGTEVVPFPASVVVSFIGGWMIGLGFAKYLLGEK